MSFISQGYFQGYTGGFEVIQVVSNFLLHRQMLPPYTLYSSSKLVLPTRIFQIDLKTKMPDDFRQAFFFAVCIIASRACCLRRSDIAFLYMAKIKLEETMV